MVTRSLKRSIIFALFLAACESSTSMPRPTACTETFTFSAPGTAACPNLDPWTVPQVQDMTTSYSNAVTCHMLAERSATAWFVAFTCDDQHGDPASDRTCVMDTEGVWTCNDFVAGRPGEDGAGACIYNATIETQAGCSAALKATACVERYTFDPPFSTDCPLLPPWVVQINKNTNRHTILSTSAGVNCNTIAEPYVSGFALRLCTNQDVQTSQRTCESWANSGLWCGDYVFGRVGENGLGDCTYAAKRELLGECP